MSASRNGDFSFTKVLRVKHGNGHVTATAGDLIVFKSMDRALKRSLENTHFDDPAWKDAMAAVEREAVDELRALWKSRRT
jgi:hypothetical protein